MSDREKYREGKEETGLQENTRRRKALTGYLWYKGSTRDTVRQKLRKQK